MMKMMGSAKRGPLAGLGQMLGFWLRHADAGADGRARQENAARRATAARHAEPAADHADIAAEYSWAPARARRRKVSRITPVKKK